MPYKAYPIYDLKSGKVTAREPWLTPQDAFETLRNGHVKYGVLEKRKGYTEVGQIVHVNTSTKVPTLSTNPVMGIFSHVSGDTDTLLVMDKKRINKYELSISTGVSITAFADAGSGEITVTAASHGFSTDDIVTISGTINYDGTYSVTKVNDNSFKITDTWVSDDATGTANQEQFVDLTRNKIRFQHASKQTWSPSATDTVKGATSNATGTVEAVVVDTGTFAGADACGTIIFANGSVTGTFQDGEELQENGTPANIVGDADGANTDDEFTGDSTNFFCAVNWNGTIYLTNDKNIIQKYDGTNLTRLHIDLDVEGGPDNNITTARFIALIKSRLVIFALTERGTTQGVRARWCSVNDPDTWPDANYVDCPIEDYMNGIEFLGDDLYVLFKKHIFRFAYTGDEDLPFEWQRIEGFEGSYAKCSPISLPHEIMAVGKRNVIGMNGNLSYTVDLLNPEFVPSWVQSSISYSQGMVWKDEKQVWFTYTSAEASANADGNIYPDSILVLDYEQKNWATYGIDIHCMGISDLEADLTWNDVTDAWEDIDWAWSEPAIQAGSDVRLFGGHAGIIYKLDYNLSDNGSSISFEALGGRWNPYVKEGRKARLGWIDFLVDNDSDASATISFYKDQITSTWKTATLNCDGSGDKFWVTVFVDGEEGEFHRIKISNTGTNNKPRIHAIVPYFKRGGKMF